MKIVTSKLVKEVLAQGEADPMKALEVFAMGSSLGIEELISAASKLCLRCGAKKLFELEIQGFPLANISPPLPATGTSNDNQVATPAATPNQAPAPAVDQTADTAAAPNQDPFGNVIPVAPVPPIFQVGPFGFASIKSTQSKPSTLFDNIWQKQQKSSAEVLLKQITAWDYHRLQSLHRQRTRSVNEILTSFTKELSGHPWDRLTTADPCCCSSEIKSKGGIRATFVEAAKKEIEESGPTSLKIFSTDFLNEVSEKCCGACTKNFLVTNYKGLRYIKARIDCLPDHI